MRSAAQERADGVCLVTSTLCWLALALRQHKATDTLPHLTPWHQQQQQQQAPCQPPASPCVAAEQCDADPYVLCKQLSATPYPLPKQPSATFYVLPKQLSATPSLQPPNRQHQWIRHSEDLSICSNAMVSPDIHNLRRARHASVCQLSDCGTVSTTRFSGEELRASSKAQEQPSDLQTAMSVASSKGGSKGKQLVTRVLAVEVGASITGLRGEEEGLGLEVLTGKNWQVTELGPGEDVLQHLHDMAEGDLPDVLLLFMAPPGMTGLAVLQALRCHWSPAQLPVIMVTCSQQQADRAVEALNAGANDYMSTPLRREELSARISTQLQLKKSVKIAIEACRHLSLLTSILPHNIIRDLKQKQGNQSIHLFHDEVTILFSDIKGFTNMAASWPTERIISLLNEMFTAFDGLCERLGVFKVETIGDAYMIVSGHDGTKDHASRMMAMATCMLDAVAGMTSWSLNDQPLQIRIGVHTGPAHSGVVGTLRPRYCFFGDTVNTASRMETTSYPMAVHVSQSTYAAVQEHQEHKEFEGVWEFVPCGPMQNKGSKGFEITYFLREGAWMEAINSLDSSETMISVRPSRAHTYATESEAASEAVRPSVDIVAPALLNRVSMLRAAAADATRAVMSAKIDGLDDVAGQAPRTSLIPLGRVHQPAKRVLSDLAPCMPGAACMPYIDECQQMNAVDEACPRRCVTFGAVAPTPSPRSSERMGQRQATPNPQAVAPQPRCTTARSVGVTVHQSLPLPAKLSPKAEAYEHVRWRQSIAAHRPIPPNPSGRYRRESMTRNATQATDALRSSDERSYSDVVGDDDDVVEMVDLSSDGSDDDDDEGGGGVSDKEGGNPSAAPPSRTSHIMRAEMELLQLFEAFMAAETMAMIPNSLPLSACSLPGATTRSMFGANSFADEGLHKGPRRGFNSLSSGGTLLGRSKSSAPPL